MKYKIPRKKNCIYEECALPDNNNVYLLQLIYAVITAFILGADRNNFTLTSILLYIAPFLIDLTQNKLNNKLFKFIKNVLTFNNILLIIFVVCGMFMIEESENCFIIFNTAIFFGGYVINKQYIFAMCLANIIVPGLLYVAAPCQKTIKRFEETESIIDRENIVEIKEKEVSTR